MCCTCERVGLREKPAQTTLVSTSNSLQHVHINIQSTTLFYDFCASYQDMRFKYDLEKKITLIFIGLFIGQLDYLTYSIYIVFIILLYFIIYIIIFYLYTSAC